MTPVLGRNTKIYVAGHRGLAGSAIFRRLQAGGYTNLLCRSHNELDLTDQPKVRAFFESERPEYVFLAAGKVGGILANDTYRAEFIHQNIAIQANVIHEAYRAGVTRLLSLGSSCIYPRDCPQPIKEEYLLTGPLEPTNRPYAIAKIAGIEMCWSYNRQYGTQYLCAMPTNLYGPGDTYDIATSHVLPALIQKFHTAKIRKEKTVTLWGSGSALREFLLSDDMADACVHLAELPDAILAPILNKKEPPLVNVGYGEDLSIKELASLVRRCVGSDAEIVWDRTKPDGTPRKLLDAGKLAALGWRARIPLERGLPIAYADFLARNADLATDSLSHA